MTASVRPASREQRRPLLTVDRLVTRFPTLRGMLHAVDGVSFTVDPGETVGVVGESGSGKSTLCRTIMRLTPESAVTTGSVEFDDVDLLRARPALARSIWGADISMVFQNPMTSLNPVVRVGRQITEVLRLHRGSTRRAARARAIELLHWVGIPEPGRRMSSYPHELSGGMRQRVCIAIAVACSPRLLFADEPIAALDVTIQRQVLDLLGTLRRRYGMATVLVTHDLAVVAGRTDRVLVMYGGRVVEAGPTRKVFRAVRHPYTASLLASIPRLSDPSHTRLANAPGRPAVMLEPAPGCCFAPRCRHAQPRCLSDDPALGEDSGSAHQVACFYPVGTPAGEAAVSANRTAGRTAAGLAVARSA